MSKERKPKLWLLRITRRLTFYRAVLAGIIVFFAGIGLICLARVLPWIQWHPTIQAITKDIGGLLIASLTLALLWEIVVKRSFLDEVLAIVRTSESLREAGIIRVFCDFDNDIDWQQLFAGTTEFDVFISYGRTWRSIAGRQLEAMAQDPLAKVRIVMPNSLNQPLMQQLATRFGRDVATVTNDCHTAETDFRAIFENKRCQFQLFLVDSAPVYTYYRFGNRVLVPFYKNQKKRGTVPALLVDYRGSLYDFFRQDFDGLLEDHAKKQKIDKQD